MERFVQRTDPVRLFWRRILSLALIILVLLGVSGVWRIYHREKESAALNEESAAHVTDLMKRETQLKVDIANLNTDRGKEAALRQQYQMGKPGEGMIIIVNPPTPVGIATTSTPIAQWFKNLFPWW